MSRLIPLHFFIFLLGFHASGNAVILDDNDVLIISDASLANENIFAYGNASVICESGAVINGQIGLNGQSSLVVMDGDFTGSISINEDSTGQIFGGRFGGDVPFSGYIGVNSALLIEGGSFGGSAMNSGAIGMGDPGASLVINGGQFGGAGRLSGQINVHTGNLCEIKSGQFGGLGRGAGRLQVHGEGEALISGGDWTGVGLQSGQVVVRDNAVVTISGGTFIAQNTGQLFVSWGEASQLSIFGCEFNLPFGNLPNPLGDAAIQGVFADGTLIDGVYSKWGTGTMTLALSPSCISDFDQDGIADEDDNCPETYNPDQLDYDGDLIGDACDPDIDNDGFPNETDACPFSIVPENEYVLIGDCNTYVIDRITSTGCALQDKLESAMSLCEGSAKNHGQFVSCAAHFLESLVEQGEITSDEKDALMGCLARSSVGKPSKSGKKP